MSRHALTDKELKILVDCEFDADAPIGDLAKACGMKSHTVRHALNCMLDRGAIRKTPLLNLLALGLSEHYVWFNLSASDATAKAKAVEFLKKCPLIWFFAEMAGQYEYWAAFVVRSPGQIKRLLEELCSRCGVVITEQQVTQTIEWRFFGRKFLSPSCPVNRELWQSRCVGRVEIDTIDHQILTALTKTSGAAAEIGRKLGIPTSTVSYRLKCLKEAGVITGWIFTNIATTTSFHRWIVLLQTGGAGDRFRKDLVDFCRMHRHVSNFGEVLGPWDFEINVEGFDSNDLSTFRHDLLGFAAGRVISSQTYAMVQVLKYCQYPLEDLPSHQ